MAKSRSKVAIPIKGPMASAHMNAATVELIEAARSWELYTEFCFKPQTRRLMRAVQRYNEAIMIEIDQNSRRSQGKSDG